MVRGTERRRPSRETEDTESVDLASGWGQGKGGREQEGDDGDQVSRWSDAVCGGMTSTEKT